ncbi:MerR family transcriptional regulator [Paenibacillus nicotianae]|uniref:MerR family transcriptional regulator n=1 Tax=Paenibacillus nicotianae TaxID=1526551 RepID=A0ABW4V3A0_9BACL
MAKEQYYSMKQMVQLTGLSKDTLRYYEQIRVLQPVARDTNNYRKYAQADLDWLKMVKLLRATGIGVTEFIDGQLASTQKRREYLEQHQLQIEQDIQKLHRIHDFLSEKVSFLKMLEDREKKE